MTRKKQKLLYAPLEAQIQVVEITGGGKLAQEIKKQGIGIGTKLKVLSKDPFILVAIRTSDWLWGGRDQEKLLSKEAANRVIVKYRDPI